MRGCGKRFIHNFWGEKICGRFEDLKHSDHYIYCEGCSQKTSFKKLGKIEYIKTKKVPIEIPLKTKDGKTIMIKATKVVKDSRGERW